MYCLHSETACTTLQRVYLLTQVVRWLAQLLHAREMSQRQDAHGRMAWCALQSLAYYLAWHDQLPSACLHQGPCLHCRIKGRRDHS